MSAQASIQVNILIALGTDDNSPELFVGDDCASLVVVVPGLTNRVNYLTCY